MAAAVAEPLTSEGVEEQRTPLEAVTPVRAQEAESARVVRARAQALEQEEARARVAEAQRLIWRAPARPDRLAVESRRELPERRFGEVEANPRTRGT